MIISHKSLFEIIQKYYKDVEQANERVRKGKAWGSMVFSQNYSESLVERTENGQNIEDYVIDSADLIVRLDMSSKRIFI